MPDDKTVKFDCLHCNQSIEAPEELVGTIVECPSCGKKVNVFNKLNIPLASLKLPKQNEDTDAEYERIRGIAGSFATIGIWLVLGSILLVGFCIAADSSSYVAFCVGCTSVGLGAWCYMLAQIIYIRAALEKRD